MIKVTDQEFWMDGYLKSNMDSIIHNLRGDWDFMLVISGSGMVRVGKSVLAQQIGYYAASKLGTPFSLSNIVFSGKQLMKVASELPRNSVILYDEARAELESKKAMQNVSKALLDFFAECGMYNHMLILVLPDFFELNKRLAVARSDALINVYRTTKPVTLKDGTEVVEFVRGHFNFYNQERKKYLYIAGKRAFDSYHVGKRNFYGEFRNHWVIDKEEYLQKKLEFLKRDRTEVLKGRAKLWVTQRDVLLNYIVREQGIKQSELVKLLEDNGVKMTQQAISQALGAF